MRDRLEVESPELAARFRSLSTVDQARVAERMLAKALDEIAPPLELPVSMTELDEVVRALDASDDEDDFRRARAATAARFLRAEALEDALYEALHARRAVDAAVDEALRETLECSRPL